MNNIAVVVGVGVGVGVAATAQVAGTVINVGCYYWGLLRQSKFA